MEDNTVILVIIGIVAFGLWCIAVGTWKWINQNQESSETERMTPARRRTAKSRLFDEQQEKCIYCGNKLSIEYFELDHIEPTARGGEDRFDNLQLLCSPCNKRKGTMTDEEFRDRYSKLDLPEPGEDPPRRAIPQKAFTVIQSLNSRRR